MAKIKQVVRIRRLKVGGNTGFKTCSTCNGTGRVKK